MAQDCKCTDSRHEKTCPENYLNKVPYAGWNQTSYQKGW